MTAAKLTKSIFKALWLTLNPWKSSKPQYDFDLDIFLN